ncbi:unnamed protein product [Polarella glacialis]|uniref:Uncharacterized protein n=1 Tax=Polarella glacialis TaxID=89957 RepID=A0A813JAN2_POLGL|nr:unnamed protein product [Polarella glacialis]
MLLVLLLNFSVLAVKLRSHVRKSNLKHEFDQLNQYRDILGAWDYAVTDPDGVLDGAVAPDSCVSTRRRRKQLPAYFGPWCLQPTGDVLSQRTTQHNSDFTTTATSD